MNILPLKPLINTGVDPKIVADMREDDTRKVLYFSEIWRETTTKKFLDIFDAKVPGVLFRDRMVFRCIEKNTIKDRLLQIVQIVPQLKYLGVDSIPEIQTVEKSVSVTLQISFGIYCMYVTPKDVIAHLISIDL